MKIVILGGGISGLAAAWYLQKNRPRAEVVLLEKEKRLGGWIQTACNSEAVAKLPAPEKSKILRPFSSGSEAATIHAPRPAPSGLGEEHGRKWPQKGDFAAADSFAIGSSGILFELGPRTFQTERCPHLLALIQEVGLADEIIHSDPEAGRRYLLHKGRLRSMASFLPRLIPALFRELFMAKSTADDESIYDFAARRFGASIADTLFDALALGIYAGDIRTLSIRSCFPHIFYLEKKWRSIVIGSLLSKKWGQKKGLFTLRRGMSCLIEALSAKLHADIRLNTEAQEIRQDGVIANGRFIPADVVISALPGSAIGRLSGLYPDFQETDLWVVNLAFDGAVLPNKGFGYLAPTQEREHLLGMIWDSSVFPQQNRGLQTRVTAMMREGSVPLALDAARRHLRITASPSFSNAFFARSAIPQFPVGYGKRLSQFEEAIKSQFPRLLCCGNYLRGASVEACIASAKGLIGSFRGLFHQV